MCLHMACDEIKGQHMGTIHVTGQQLMPFIRTQHCQSMAASSPESHNSGCLDAAGVRRGVRRTNQLVVVHEAPELAPGAQVVELAQREGCAGGPCRGASSRHQRRGTGRARCGRSLSAAAPPAARAACRLTRVLSRHRPLAGAQSNSKLCSGQLCSGALAQQVKQQIYSYVRKRRPVA